MKKILSVLLLGGLIMLSLPALARRVNPQMARDKISDRTPPAPVSVQKAASAKHLYVQTAAAFIKQQTENLKIVDASGRVNGPDMVKFLGVLNEVVKQYPEARTARRFEATISRKAFDNACPGEFAKTLNGNRWLHLVKHAKDGSSKTYEMYEFTSILYNVDPSSPENGYITVTYADKTRQKFNAKGVLVKK